MSANLIFFIHSFTFSCCSMISLRSKSFAQDHIHFKHLLLRSVVIYSKKQRKQKHKNTKTKNQTKKNMAVIFKITITEVKLLSI